jgi:transcriptional regulator with XRE-family HTH domain
MINAAQIRAARALLGWRLADLARATSMTINGISKIERGEVPTSRQQTLNKIQQAFEMQGVEFLPNSGVRRRDWTVEAYEGADANKRNSTKITLCP